MAELARRLERDRPDNRDVFDSGFEGSPRARAEYAGWNVDLFERQGVVNGSRVAPGTAEWASAY